MNWRKAFMTNHPAQADKVATYLRNTWGWQVAVSFGRIDQIVVNDGMRNRKAWNYERGLNIDEQLDRVRDTLELYHGWQTWLDEAFPQTQIVGKYTILPLPKDIEKPAPATATSTSLKAGGSLLPNSTSSINQGD